MSLAQTTHEMVTILETREAPPTHFLMKVESFSLLHQNQIDKYETGEFKAGGHNWRLILMYPNEEETGIDSKYVSVHLAISADTAAANWEVTAVFSIFLLNQISGNYHYSLGRTQRFQAMKSEWGISKFISKETLMDPSNGFVVNNNCVFGAEVFIVEKLAVFECLSLKNASIPHKRDWKITDFSQLGHKWTSDKFLVGGLNWKYSGEGYLNLIDSKRVKACFSISIKDQINYKHKKFTQDSHWFSPPSSPNWGWGQFMEVSTLEDAKNGFITNDSCHLQIELSIQAVVD